MSGGTSTDGAMGGAADAGEHIATVPDGRSDTAATEGPGGKTRPERIENRVRNPKWKNVPLRIEMSECINCDTCLRHCPPQFGAIFNHGIDVIIIPELCSGCGKCLPPVCPVDCIYEDPEWDPAPDDWWQEPITADVY